METIIINILDYCVGLLGHVRILRALQKQANYLPVFCFVILAVDARLLVRVGFFKLAVEVLDHALGCFRTHGLEVDRAREGYREPELAV